jgi:hypothetical protein
MPRQINFDDYYMTGRYYGTAPRQEEVTFTESEAEPIIAEEIVFSEAEGETFRAPEEIVFGEAEGETFTAPAPPPIVGSVPNVLASPRGEPPGTTPSAPYAGILDPPGTPNWLFSRPRLRRPRRRVQPMTPPSGPPSPPVPVRSIEQPGSYEPILRAPLPSRESDLETLANEVARLVRLGQPGYHSLLWHLQQADLDRNGLAGLLSQLEARDALQPFLRLARREEVWTYLRDRGVEWQFIFDHYRLGPTDIADFMAGMAAGVGVNVGEMLTIPLDLLEGLYVLTGSAFNADLARRRDEFFAAMKRLLTSPVATATMVGQQWWQRFNDHLGQLRLFEAGAMIGKVLPDLVAAAKGAAKVAAKAGDLAVAAGRRLAASAPVLTSEIAGSLMTSDEMRDMIQVFRRGENSWTSPTGLRMERTAADEVVLRNPEGSVIARLDDTARDEIVEAIGRFDDAPGEMVPHVGRVNLDLGGLARRVTAEIPQGSLSPGVWGTRIHARAAEILRADPALTGWVVAADVPFRSVFNLGEVADMTVEQFYKRFGALLPEGLPRDKKTLATIIGDKKPDLAIYNPATGEAIVADLTTVAQVRRQSHFRKTYLDMEILKIAIEQGYAKGISFMRGGDYGYQ